jgi:hypothetical protein
MMISGHFDGQLIAKTIGYLSFESIFSDKKKPTQLIFQALRAIKNGYDIGITPDGPRGPRHEVSEGIILLAQKMKAPIVFFQCVPTRYRQVKSWDKFVVPKLFGTLDFYASEAVRIDTMTPQDAKQIIKEGLMQHAF